MADGCWHERLALRWEYNTLLVDFFREELGADIWVIASMFYLITWIQSEF